jgi:hypothetical protein
MLEQLSNHEAPFEARGMPTSSEALRALEERLDRGWEVISTAERKGEPTDTLMHHFITLLEQYEHLYDRLRAV